jgi:hypothetical protein
MARNFLVFSEKLGISYANHTYILSAVTPKTFLNWYSSIPFVLLAAATV